MFLWVRPDNCAGYRLPKSSKLDQPSYLGDALGGGRPLPMPRTLEGVTEFIGHGPCGGRKGVVLEHHARC